MPGIPSMTDRSFAGHHGAVGAGGALTSWSGSTVNKADLAKELEKKFGSRKAANDALEAVLDTIIREVVRGGKVSITGFGTFDRVERAARTGRELAAQRPAHARRADEAEKRDAWVGRQLLGEAPE